MFCENCGERVYNGACVNCHEEVYIIEQNCMNDEPVNVSGLIETVNSYKSEIEENLKKGAKE